MIFLVNTMRDRIKKIISDNRIILSIYILFAIAASFQTLSGTKTYFEGSNQYNRYNNYTIFEKSFEHLKNKQNLYVLYPEEHWDLFKYTPTFAAFFGVFSMLPDWLGLSLWNLLNALVLLAGIYFLPKLSTYQKGLISLLVVIELLTAMQNHQSNALIAGLIVCSFGFLERNNSFLATLCIVFSMYIKLFGIVGFALFLFYPNKWKSALYSLFWMAILYFIPLIFVDSEHYLKLWSSYFHLLTNDHVASYGYSVMGWIHSWFALEINKNVIVAIGIIIFLIPFNKHKTSNDYHFKTLLLCSILIWIVIFNHMAESPTFIIAMTGVAIWFIQSKKSTVNIILFISAFIFTSAASTDIFPSEVREQFIKPYALKELPCILIWVKIIYDMITYKNNESSIPLPEVVNQT